MQLRHPKAKTVSSLLVRGVHLNLHIDARQDGVVVPESLRRRFDLILLFGYHLPVPIADLVVSDEGVSGTLSFSRAPFHVRMPWHAVYGFVDASTREGGVWPQDLPAEVKLAAQQPPTEPQPAVAKSKRELPPYLKVVK